MIFLKKGQSFKCWKCGIYSIFKATETIYTEDKIGGLHKKCEDLKTSTPWSLRKEGIRIKDNKTKCSRCGALVYDKISKTYLPDELFEI